MGVFLSIFLCLAFPALARAVERSERSPAWLSSIIACYGVGILVANLRLWEIDQGITEGIAAASMLFGLPLLLFSVRLRDSWRYGRSMLVGFLLCCFCGLLCTGLTGWYLGDGLADGWKVAGMLVGLYTGGTPNVQAIGLALRAPADYVVLIQAADVLLGGAYLLGLVTFLPALYARFYPTPKSGEEAVSPTERPLVPARLQWQQTGLAAAVVAVSGGLTWLLSGEELDTTVLILVLTTLSLIVAGQPFTQRLGNAYPLGEYFILIFCVALGLLADFRALAENGRELLLYSALALSTTTVLHLLLCKLFRLDRDTVILSSVAAFYGPVFVAQVATAIRNQRLLASGIAVSLLGLGIGNYLGLALAYLVRWALM